MFILYGATIGWLLSRLNIRLGFPLAAVLLFIHALGLSKVTTCGFRPLYPSHSATGCYAYNYILFILPVAVFVLILLGARLPERFGRWSRRLFIPFAVIWMLLMVYGVFRAAFPPVSPWTPLAPVHSPGPRTMAAIAYDTKRQRAVLFGGITVWNGDTFVYDSSTWEWDGTDWKQIDTPVAPAGRVLHAMAYDEQRGRVVLYGGENDSGNLGDLWEWDGVTWHRLCPVCNPAARFAHRMIYDPERQEIKIYGGQDGEKSFTEGWTWNGQSWTYFQFEETTPGLYYSPLIYDNANKRVVTFMGGRWGGTWIWEGNNWLKLELTAQPPIRDESVLVHDPVEKYSVLFGGTTGYKFLFDDTWIFDGKRWSRVNTPVAPGARYRAVAFYDPVRRSVIIYGGERLGSNYSDMWEFKLPESEQQ
jgi:hypothetical protein